MKHPHAEIIKALADDDSLTLWAKNGNSDWLLVDYDKLRCVVRGPDTKFHLGPTPPPRMIETPFGSYPEPLREAPKSGTMVFRFDPDGDTTAIAWEYWSWQRKQLSAGVLHLTREAAEQQAQVELKRRMAELGWEKS